MTTLHHWAVPTRLLPTRMLLCSVLLCSVLLLVGLASQPLLAQDSPEVTEAMVTQWMTDLSNWGRWGDDDQLGTLNLITAEKRLEAISLARVGTSVSLSHNYLKERAADATSPFVHEMSGIGGPGAFVSDRYSISYHGYAHSHLDALCHMMYEGRLYNGYVRDDEVTESGCNKLAIINFKQGIVTRGILMDIARLKGVEYLEPGMAIYVEDLEAWERAAGIRVGSGDVVLVRSGRWARRAEVGPWATGREAAGLHASVVPWLHERGVAILGSDDTSDVRPSRVEGHTQPVHQLMLVALGTPLFDNLDLEAVAAEAARQGRWEFMLVAAPLAVEGGTGSPLNPLAIF